MVKRYDAHSCKRSPMCQVVRSMLVAFLAMSIIPGQQVTGTTGQHINCKMGRYRGLCLDMTR